MHGREDNEQGDARHDIRWGTRFVGGSRLRGSRSRRCSHGGFEQRSANLSVVEIGKERGQSATPPSGSLVPAAECPYARRCRSASATDDRNALSQHAKRSRSAFQL
jgi:hypothetical protein